MKKAYGQVYRTLCPSHGPSEEWPHGMAFRGILMDDTHAEVWWGTPKPTPDEAFADMEKAARSRKIEDVRRWSGTLP